MVLTASGLAGNIAPMVGGPERIDARLGEAVQYVFNVSDPGDTVTVNLTRNIPTAVIEPPLNSTLGLYTLRFTLTTTDVVTLEILATDNHGSSTLLSPLLVLCPCQNDQTCQDLLPGQDGGNTSFVLATCNCSQGERPMQGSVQRRIEFAIERIL